MKNTHRVLARDMPGIFHSSTGLPTPYARQVITTLKLRRRISLGRPVSPPPTSRDIARIIFGLSAPSLRLAAEVEWNTGRQPLFAGIGKETAEAELIDLIESAAGWHERSVDFREGSLLIGQTVPMVDVRSQGIDGNPVIRTYRTIENDSSQKAQSFFLLPLGAIRNIARDLLPREAPEYA